MVGFWYNKNLFKQAGITSTPTTWPQFMAAVNKLKAADITPISVGGKDRWPDAFYWDYLATKLCSKTTMQQSAVTYNFKDPCWLKAGVYVQQLLDAKPFQDGFLATPAQQIASSSAGLLANGKVAMELQGHWNAGVMQPLTPNSKVPSFLGWFAFPNVPGSKATPGSLLGGGDGFACSAKAPEPAVCAVPRVHRQPGRAEAHRLDELRTAGAEGHGNVGHRSEPEDGSEGSVELAVHPALPRHRVLALDRSGARRRDRRPVRRQGDTGAGRFADRISSEEEVTTET